jgi:hypothetical protein
LNFTPDDWNQPFGNGGVPFDGGFYIEVARALERACFDYMMIEDKLLVPEAYGGSAEAVLRLGMMAPKHDPASRAGISTYAGRSIPCGRRREGRSTYRPEAPRAAAASPRAMPTRSSRFATARNR